jgi:hypothetical protein
VFWLGAKQILMLLVLGILGTLLPTFVRMGRVVAAHPAGAAQLSEEARLLFQRARPYVLLMRAAGLLALAFAVFRPGASAV